MRPSYIYRMFCQQPLSYRQYGHIKNIKFLRNLFYAEGPHSKSYFIGWTHSQWVIVVLRQMSNVQLYHGKTLVHLNELMMMSTLYWTNTLSWTFIVVLDWNNMSWVDMSLHSDILFWCRTNQPLFLLLIAVCIAEMQHAHIL